MDKNQIDITLHNESGQLLLDYIKGKKFEPLQIKAAMSGYNGSTRAMSTSRVADAMQYTIIKDIAKDKTELDKYVRATLPQFIPDKLLE